MNFLYQLSLVEWCIISIPVLLIVLIYVAFQLGWLLYDLQWNVRDIRLVVLNARVLTDDEFTKRQEEERLLGFNDNENTPTIYSHKGRPRKYTVTDEEIQEELNKHLLVKLARLLKLYP